MRDITVGLHDHFQSEVTTLAICWRIEIKDGVVIGFTDYDKPLRIDDIKYDSIAGFTPTNITSGSEMAVNNLDIAGQIYESKVTEVELLAGKYDFASLEVFLVNYQRLERGRLIQKRGIIGEVTLKKKLVYAEIRGLTQFLSKTLYESYSPHCRAQLGDSRCGFDLSQGHYTVVSEITEIIDHQTFKAGSLNQEADWFKYGYLTWRSGGNSGTKMEIKEFAQQRVSLSLPMPFAMHVGDQFTIVAAVTKAARLAKSNLTISSIFAASLICLALIR